MPRTTLCRLCRILKLPKHRRVKGGRRKHLTSDDMRPEIRRAVGRGTFPDALRRCDELLREHLQNEDDYPIKVVQRHRHRRSQFGLQIGRNRRSGYVCGGFTEEQATEIAEAHGWKITACTKQEAVDLLYQSCQQWLWRRLEAQTESQFHTDWQHLGF